MLVLELVARSVTSPSVRCLAVCTCKWMAALATELILPTSVRVKTENIPDIGMAIWVGTYVGEMLHGTSYRLSDTYLYQHYEITHYWDGDKRIACEASIDTGLAYTVTIYLPGAYPVLKIKNGAPAIPRRVWYRVYLR